jgi:folate-binding protein YgfZ
MLSNLLVFAVLFHALCAFEFRLRHLKVRPLSVKRTMITTPSSGKLDAALYDSTDAVSVLSVQGRDRIRYLQSLASNDFSNSTKNDLVKCSFLDADARVIDTAKCLVMNDAVLVVLDHADSTVLENYLKKNIFPVDDVTVINLVGVAMVHLLFPIFDDKKIPTSIQNLNPAFSSLQTKRFSLDDTESLIAFRDDDLRSEMFSVLFLEKTRDAKQNLLLEAEPRGITRMNDEDFEAERIFSGKPRFGREYGVVSKTTGKLQFTALEAGMMGMLHFRKGCYVGNEAVSRIVSTNSIRRKLFGLEIHNVTLSSSEPFDLLDEDGEIAIQVTSVAFKHNNIASNVSILRCLGYVRSKYAISGKTLDLFMTSSGTSSIAIRTTIMQLNYPKFLPEESPAPPIPKSSNPVNSDQQTENEIRRQEKLKQMQEKLAKFKASSALKQQEH